MGLETLAIVGLVTSAVGAGFSAYGSIQQGKQAQREANYKAKVAKNEATVAKEKATFEADRKRARNRKIRGMQIAQAGKGGTTTSGSTRDIMFATDLDAELDVLTSLYTGDLRAAGQVSKANMLEQSGKFQKQMGYVQGTGTLLTGAGNVMTGTAMAGSEFGWFG